MGRDCLSGGGPRDFLARGLGHRLEVEGRERYLIEQIARRGIVFSYRWLRQIPEGKVKSSGLIRRQMPKIEPVVDFHVIAQVGKLAKFTHKRAVDIVNGNQMIAIGAAHGDLVVRQRDDLGGFRYWEMSEQLTICCVDANGIAT